MAAHSGQLVHGIVVRLVAQAADIHGVQGVGGARVDGGAEGQVRCPYYEKYNKTVDQPSRMCRHAARALSTKNDNGQKVYRVPCFFNAATSVLLPEQKGGRALRR